MKILFVSPSLPVPLTSGGAIRVFNLVRHLSETDEIDFLALDDGSTPEAEIKPLRACCANVCIIAPRRLTRFREAVRVGRKLARGEPFYAKYADRPELRRRLLELTAANDYDLVHVEHTYMAGLAQSIRIKRAGRLILSSENVASEQFKRMFLRERHPVEKLKLFLTWWPMRRWETASAESFDHLLAVTERDRGLYQAMNPALTVSVVPNGVDTDACRPVPREGRERNLLMVGSLDYAPNVDAVLHFHGAIWPLIRRSSPEARLLVVGKNPPDAVRRLHRPGRVEVCPDAPEVASFYGRSLLAPVALRAGGGSRLKILEALAHGLPVVSTKVGCEGLAVQPERDILVADDPAEFAKRALDVMQHPDLWSRLACHGRDLVQQHYDWKHISRGLREAYRACLARPATRKEAP